MQPSETDTKALLREPSPSGIELYRIYRDYIVHEDGLINNRVGWFIQLHSFLIATYGIVVTAIMATFFPQGKPSIPGVYPQIVACLLLGGISVTGLISSRTAKHSIRAADQAIETLRESWNAVAGKRTWQTELPGVTGGGHPEAAKLGAGFHLLLPKSLFVLWCGSFAIPVIFIGLALWGERRSVAAAEFDAAVADLRAARAVTMIAPAYGASPKSGDKVAVGENPHDPPVSVLKRKP